MSQSASQLGCLYGSIVGDESLDESVLRANIASYQASLAHQSTLYNRLMGEDILNFRSLNSLHSAMSITNNRLQQEEEKLDRLLTFESQSASVFSDLARLKQSITSGFSEVRSSYGQHASLGGFRMPEDMAWKKDIDDRWKERTEAIRSGYDAVVKKVEKGEELTEEDLVALVQFMQEYPDKKIPDYILKSFERVGPDFDEKLATMLTAGHATIDYKLLGVKSFLEGVAVNPAIKSGAWKGATWWKKMKSLNSAVQATDYVDNVSNFGKTVKVGAGLADDAAHVAGKTASLGSKAWSHLGYLGAAGAVFNGYSVYADRKNRYGEDIAMRDAAVHTGITATSTIIGSALGSAIPIPVVGTLLGAYVGSVIGNRLATTYDQGVHDKIEWKDYSNVLSLW